MGVPQLRRAGTGAARRDRSPTPANQRELEEVLETLDRVLLRTRTVARVAAIGGQRELFILAGRASDEAKRAIIGLEMVLKDR
jgi:hypothetical protein